MDINLVTQKLPPPARVQNEGTKKSEAKVGTPVARELPSATTKPVSNDGKTTTTNTTDSASRIEPPLASVTVELSIHKASGRVVGRVVDRETHAIVKELPSEELLHYLERTREFFDEIIGSGLGQAIDKQV